MLAGGGGRSIGFDTITVYSVKIMVTKLRISLYLRAMAVDSIYFKLANGAADKN